MNCKLLRMSLLCLLFLFIFCINVSFANINYDNFTQWSYNGTREDLSNVIFDEYLDVSFTNYRDYMNPNLGSSDKEKVDTFFTRFFSNDFTCFWWSVLTGNSNYYKTNYIYIYLSTNDFSSTTYRYTFYRRSNSSYWSCTLSSSTGSLTVDGSIGNGSINKYLLNSNGLFYKNGSYTPPNIVTNLTYNNFKTNTIEVHYNGNIENFIKADYSDSVSSWRLGSFSNFDSSGIDELYGYLYGFAGSSNQGVIYSDLVASFLWKKGVGSYTNNLYFPDNSDHAVYVNPQVITLYQGYTLMFDAFINREEQEVINKTTYLYFVPYGSSATSGDLISPDFNSGLDWNFINSMENLISSDSGNTEYIYNSNFNSSGDNIFGITYNDFDNWGFGDFVISSVGGFYNAFTNYDNITLNFGYLGDINSSQFVTPDNTLFQFVGLISNSFLILTCIGFFYYTILDISTFNIDGLVKDREDLGLF